MLTWIQFSVRKRRPNKRRLSFTGTVRKFLFSNIERRILIRVNKKDGTVRIRSDSSQWCKYCRFEEIQTPAQKIDQHGTDTSLHFYMEDIYLYTLLAPLLIFRCKKSMLRIMTWRGLFVCFLRAWFIFFVRLNTALLGGCVLLFCYVLRIYCKHMFCF